MEYFARRGEPYYSKKLMRLPVLKEPDETRGFSVEQTLVKINRFKSVLPIPIPKSLKTYTQREGIARDWFGLGLR